MQHLDRRCPRCVHTFLCALAIAVLTFLPFVLYDGGYFIYYGDFNVQQIPFYKLAHEAVRSGDLYWNWYTDLGTNFIGSYSFYLLFSPFFWLTLPFPTSWLPFLMAPLLVLKTACAATTAHCYLRRFLRSEDAAAVGGLLYAFSGWMDFNIFFNHFHEVAVFFPLLLLAVEQLVVDGRKGPLALAVLVNAAVNYWFFVGEAVFVLIYVLVRMRDRSWGMTVGKFLRIAVEAVLGVGCGAAVLLPSVLALMGNPRTGLEELLSGWGFWLYWHEQRQPAILQSLVFPPELPARPNFFPDHGAKWASLSAWLPMFSLSGVLAYCFSRTRDWLKRLLAACLVIALVPGLNSLFILLNNSYYARWFYMPILLMSLATMRAVEDCADYPDSFARALRWTGAVMALFVVMCGLTPNLQDGEWRLGMGAYPDVLWVYVFVAAAGLALTALLVLVLRHHRRFWQLLGMGVAVVSLLFTTFYISQGKYSSERTNYMVNTAIGGRELISLPEEPFARSDVSEGTDNLLMFWRLPNIQAFHSIVPVSIMEFYPEVGVKRDVGSRPETRFYALRPLLSVRWLFIQADKENQSPMPGYTKNSEQVGFMVYENDNYLPMGFAYDHYIYRKQLEDVEKDLRSNLMLRAIVLDEDGIGRNGDLLSHLDTWEPPVLDYESMVRDVDGRRRYTAQNFYFDRLGFGADTDFDTDHLLFFSVPYEKGWSAVVNGEPAVIEKANIGFMAVRVPAGLSEIRFSYRTPGLTTGLTISLLSALALVLYWLLSRRWGNAQEANAAPVDVRSTLQSGRTVHLSGEDYREHFDAEHRADELQRALNRAAMIHMDESLAPEERSLHFRISPEEEPDTEQDVGDDA